MASSVLSISSMQRDAHGGVAKDYAARARAGNDIIKEATMTLRSLVSRIAPSSAWSSRWRMAAAIPAGYWLTRFVLLRLLGFVYFIAFLIAVRHLLALGRRRGL